MGAQGSDDLGMITMVMNVDPASGVRHPARISRLRRARHPRLAAGEKAPGK